DSVDLDEPTNKPTAALLGVPTAALVDVVVVAPVFAAAVPLLVEAASFTSTTQSWLGRRSSGLRVDVVKT
ncbi:hypothetical protein F441_17698, partial [Phytophthora nicotianae CJ01A1]